MHKDCHFAGRNPDKKNGVFIKRRPKTRPKIENEDEDAYNNNSIQSRFSTSSANRPFCVTSCLMNKRKSSKLSAEIFGLRFAE